MDQATTCGLLANELISNSLKYGFVQGGPGSVCIELFPVIPIEMSSPARWYLRVSDTSVGLPEDFEQRCLQSLGMQLVSVNLVMQIIDLNVERFFMQALQLDPLQLRLEAA